MTDLRHTPSPEPSTATPRRPCRGSRDPMLGLRAASIHAASIHAAIEDGDAARKHLSVSASAAAFPVVHAPAAARLAADLGLDLDETWQVTR